MIHILEIYIKIINHKIESSSGGWTGRTDLCVHWSSVHPLP